MLIWPFSFFTAAIAGHMKFLGYQKLDKIIFQQSEHSICTITYMFAASMDPDSAANQSALNPLPPKKSKTHTKDKHIFLTNKWLLHLLHTGMSGGLFIVWNYVI